MAKKISKRKELKNKEHYLTEQEKLIVSQEQQLKEMKITLSKQEQELTKRQSFLEQKEKELAEQEARLNELENSNLSYQYWKSCEELKIFYDEIQAKITNLQPTIREFGTKGQCRFFHYPMQSLATLHREIAFMNEFKNTDVPNRIDEILCHLGAEKIEPLYNDIYDSKKHERMDATYIGTKIDYCVAWGWSFKEEVLVRALVITHE